MEIVLLTGGTGFIGSKVVRRLMGVSGLRVYVLSRYPRKDDGNVSYIEGDITNIGMLKHQIAKYHPTILCHLAWNVEGDSRDNTPQEQCWKNWSIALARQFLEAGGKHIVSSGTCFEYDVFQNCLLEESMRTDPHTAYGAAKVDVCSAMQELCRQYGARFVWGRIFYAYGPGEAKRKLLTSLKTTLLSGERFVSKTPEFVVDYIHVEDVAAILVKCITDVSVAGILNICSGQGVRIRDLVLRMAYLFKKEDYVNFSSNGARMFVVGDNKRLRALGYKYQYDLPSGIATYASGGRCEKN